ncbi:hypothetical protein BRX36_03970 [Sphingomonas sp. S-NIH.Pt1_0416]|nr:hypothetical protein DRN02_013245 [Sphingomonas paucimobilis]RSU67794.1 hypothetical protein BRX36_03970 [Sphingomonas sp. S-NIH.Pt1_0416]
MAGRRPDGGGASTKDVLCCQAPSTRLRMFPLPVPGRITSDWPSPRRSRTGPPAPRAVRRARG